MRRRQPESQPEFHYQPKEVRGELLLDHFPCMEEVLEGHEDTLLIRLDDNIAGTFKVRGAERAVSHYYEQGDSDFCASTEGNHGLGMVVAVANVEGRLTIYGSRTMARQKIDKMYKVWSELTGRPEDFQILLAGENVNEAKKYALAHNNARFVDPFDDPYVIQGQGTAALDTVHTFPDVTDLVMSVGGGGLGAGTVSATDRRVHLVEAEGNNSLSKTLRSGRNKILEADKLNPRYGGLRSLKSGQHVVRLLRNNGFDPRNITTADDEVVKGLAASYESWELPHALEGSALVAVAGLVNIINEGRIARNDRVAVFATGHNDSPDKLLTFSDVRRMQVASAQVLR